MNELVKEAASNYTLNLTMLFCDDIKFYKVIGERYVSCSHVVTHMLSGMVQGVTNRPAMSFSTQY